jgi:hypothetical protein
LVDKRKKTILHEFCNNFFVDFSNRAINFDEDTRSRRSLSSANVARPFTNDVNDAASALLHVSRLNDKSTESEAPMLLTSRDTAEQSTESEAPMLLTSRDTSEQSTESEAPMQQHSIIQKITKNKMLVRGGITTMRLKN